MIIKLSDRPTTRRLSVLKLPGATTTFIDELAFYLQRPSKFVRNSALTALRNGVLKPDIFIIFFIVQLEG